MKKPTQATFAATRREAYRKRIRLTFEQIRLIGRIRRNRVRQYERKQLMQWRCLEQPRIQGPQGFWQRGSQSRALSHDRHEVSALDSEPIEHATASVRRRFGRR